MFAKGKIGESRGRRTGKRKGKDSLLSFNLKIFLSPLGRMINESGRGWKRTNLHVVVSVEGLETKRAGELGRTNQNLSRGRDPILTASSDPIREISGRFSGDFIFV